MIRRCRVIVEDLNGVTHSTEVCAASLYEAVAGGIAAIKASEWVGELPEGLSRVRVVLPAPEVEHTVTVKRFQEWLTRDGGAPAEKVQRARVREILGQRA